MSQQENDSHKFFEQMERQKQFEAEIAPLRKAVMQGLIQNRVVDKLVELNEEILRLRVENRRLQNDFSLLEKLRLQREITRLRSENFSLRSEILSIESKHSSETNKKVREAQKAARRNSGCGCLVLLAAGLSAFSLFTIYQI